MSRVFVAEELALGRHVVVKVLEREMAQGVSADRFAREAKLAARLQDPRIVPVLAAGAAGDLPYYTMPFVDGESLRARLTRAAASGQPVPLDESVSILRDIALALDPQLRAWRLGATMFTVFGGLAFVVAIVGLYGVLAYSVAQRRFEFGVRMALGAPPANIARLVLSRGARAMGIGLALGLVIAAVAGPAVEPLLFRVKAVDSTVYLTVITIVAVTTIGAAYVPSRRAGKTDPLTALRAD